MGLNRVPPSLPIGAYTTYGMRAPRSTHTRQASCAEAGCLAQERGWVTTVDETSVLGQRQAYYIRSMARRHYTEDRTEGGLTRFTFPAGQTCFQEHRVSLDRPEVLIARRGDWRVQPARHEIQVHTRADDWLDEFANNQIKLAEIIQKG